MEKIEMNRILVISIIFIVSMIFGSVNVPEKKSPWHMAGGGIGGSGSDGGSGNDDDDDGEADGAKNGDQHNAKQKLSRFQIGGKATASPTQS